VVFNAVVSVSMIAYPGKIARKIAIDVRQVRNHATAACRRKCLRGAAATFLDSGSVNLFVSFPGSAGQHHRHQQVRRQATPGSLASLGQSFQFKVKYYGLNCIMVSFPRR
jgi:hypothetical protein